VKRMLLAVSSNEPDQPLETATEAAPKHPDYGGEGIFRRGFENSVRGIWERVAGMQWKLPTGNDGSVRRGGIAPGAAFGRLTPAALLLGALLFSGAAVSSAHAQSAGSWNKRGQQAEARQDYDAAFEAYRQAHLKKPSDLRYRTSYESMRFQAANTHVDRGRVLRQSGDMDGAINEFARALQIDPGNQAAAQELQLLEKRGPQAGAPAGGGGGAGVASPGAPLVPGMGEETPYQHQMQKEIRTLDGPVALQPVSDDPITLSMVADTKVVYEAICKASGLNVIFDPEYVPKNVPVNLNSVSLPDALHIVGVLSGTFWKPVTSNTIFVAANTRTKRTELDDLAVQTFYLTNVSQQNDANEIMVAIRNMMDTSVKIYLVASQNALVMRASPDELILAEKIINDLDRTKPEVVVDVAELEVSRQLERDIGITLPTSFGLTPQYSNANISTSTGTATTTSTSTNTTTSGLTLNTLGNLNATNFAVTLSGGTVNALLSDSDTRILQNPRIRATDGQHASLKVGSKIPIATGSYSAGTAITTASLGVQTQFTYLDVGTLIDMTPTVHYDGEISLKLKVEVSAQTNTVTIDGVQEPIISQRVAEQQIQLKDGEPALLAGLMQVQDTKNINGTPGLGELPILKYFFASTDKTQESDDVVFLIIPHIVRESILTDENTRAIYAGTSTSVELIRKVPNATPTVESSEMAPAGNSLPATSAANAASAMIGKMAADAKPVTPESMAGMQMQQNGTMSAAPASGPAMTLAVTPAASSEMVGSTFQVAVVASGAHDLFAVPLQIQFDPRVLSLVNVDTGDLLGKDGQNVGLVHRDEGNGAVTISATRPPGAKGVDGQGTVVTLTFKALTPGDATLALTRIGAKDSQQNRINATGVQAVVHVK
jgi:general secretion pathway protein D